jgi:hypothetical protein
MFWSITSPFLGSENKPNKKLAEVDGFSLLPASANFLFGLLFYLAHEDDMFLGNVGLLVNYTLN